MNRKYVRRYIFCVMAVIVGIGACWAAVDWPSSVSAALRPPPSRWLTFPLASGWSLNSDVNGERVVWAQTAWGGGPPTCNLEGRAWSLHQSALSSEPPVDICLYDAQTGLITTVVGDGAYNFWPRLAGDWLVWRTSEQMPRVRARNLATADEVELPSYFPAYPNIDGHLVVFETDGKIAAFDLFSQQVITQVAAPGSIMGFPDISGDTMVWMQARSNYPEPPDWNILGYDLTSEAVFTISDRLGSELYPRIDGDRVIWGWQENIYGYDLASGQRLTVTEAAGIQEWPAVSGNLVVWMDGGDIAGKDLATNEAWLIWTGPYAARQPSVWGHLVAWDLGYDGAAAARKMAEFRFLPLLNSP
jgi:hypothetical protein